MHLSAKFQCPSSDFRKYREALHAKLAEALAQAATAWIDTATPPDTANPVIPVWSGASRATFSQLANYIGYVLTYPIADGGPDRISLGESMGSGTFVAGTGDPGIYSFSYETTLPHLNVNERYDARQWGYRLVNPGPYNFVEKGREAVRKVFTEFVMPSWQQSLIEIKAG